MVTEAIAAFTAVGGLGAIPTGQRAIRRRRHRTCLRDTYTLERELGIIGTTLADALVSAFGPSAVAIPASRFAEMKKANRDERIRNAGYVAGRASAANAGKPRRYR